MAASEVDWAKYTEEQENLASKVIITSFLNPV